MNFLPELLWEGKQHQRYFLCQYLKKKVIIIPSTLYYDIQDYFGPMFFNSSTYAYGYALFKFTQMQIEIETLFN